jgi:hypothetical protein
MLAVHLEELPNIVKRYQMGEDNDYDQHLTTIETTPTRTNLGGNQGLAAREPQEVSGRSQSNRADDEPRSAGASTGTGQDSDEALKFNRLQAIRDLDEMEKSSSAEVYVNDNEETVITTRTELELQDAYTERQAARSAERPLARQNRPSVTREPASRSGSATQDTSRPQPRSNGARAREGQDSDQALTSYTEAEGAPARGTRSQ